MSTILENVELRLELDREAGGLAAVTNKPTGETYAVAGDTFAVATTKFHRTQQQMRQVEWTVSADAARARYADARLSIKEIAAQCGFDDPYHFSRVFRQLDGLSASQYREAVLASRSRYVRHPSKGRGVHW